MALDIPQFKAPDFVGPIAAAMAMHEKRENEKTQRMFAENQMRRQSAQDLREQKKFEQEQEDRKRIQEIQQADAFQRISHMQPGDPNAAVLGNAYGIDVHPLLGATQAALPQSTTIDTSKQPLPSNAESNDLSPEGNGAPEDEQTETAPDAEIENLMRESSSVPSPASSDAVDRELAGSREESQATPLLYEAVMGGKHYKLNAKPTSVFGDPKYDAQVERFVSSGMDLQTAQKLVLAQKEKDDNAQAIADRMRASIEQRGDVQRDLKNEFNLTAEQRLAEAEKNRQNAAGIGAAHDRAHIAASGMMAGPRQQSADTGERSGYMNVVKEAKSAAGANKDMATLKNIEKIEEELHSNSPAAQNAAVDTLAQIAQGGKASISVMNVFQKHSVGPLERAEDVAYQALHNGQHSPKYLKSLRNAVTGLKAVAAEQRSRALEAFDAQAGNKSHYSTMPELAPFVKDARDAYMSELGISPEKPTGPRKLSKEEISGGSFLP